ncbi:uncharacterized protein LOC121372870 isoform X1 [Gigantopelta aegis]|uniref:uncharacterized protein LOC121372870 isoform X1 n=1 Tax=Gigantopelta aegis TaxID=1735272 RepID=UPI001B8881C8|nr:uncharacterized protein LOC121372870 isoform X1 [Gigantopelta aegis]
MKTLLYILMIQGFIRICESNTGRNITGSVPSNGVCTDFRYGDDCDQTCNCRNETEVCDKKTGRCKSGCAHGWTGDACDDERRERRKGEKNKSEEVEKNNESYQSGILDVTSTALMVMVAVVAVIVLGGGVFVYRKMHVLEQESKETLGPQREMEQHQREMENETDVGHINQAFTNSVETYHSNHALSNSKETHDFFIQCVLGK